MIEYDVKWFWMTQWCSERGLSPWIESNWARAEEEYNKFKVDKDIKENK